MAGVIQPEPQPERTFHTAPPGVPRGPDSGQRQGIQTITDEQVARLQALQTARQQIEQALDTFVLPEFLQFMQSQAIKENPFFKLSDEELEQFQQSIQQEAGALLGQIERTPPPAVSLPREGPLPRDQNPFIQLLQRLGVEI